MLKWIGLVLALLTAATLFAMRRGAPRALHPVAGVSGYVSVFENPADPGSRLVPATGALVRIEWHGDVDLMFDRGRACLGSRTVTVQANGEFSAPAWKTGRNFSNPRVFMDSWAPGKQINHLEFVPLEYSGIYRNAAVLQTAASGTESGQEAAFRKGRDDCPAIEAGNP